MYVRRYKIYIYIYIYIYTDHVISAVCTNFS